MNDKQRRFAEEYLIDSKATQAAIRAGYSERTAAEQGYQLLQKPSVTAAIQTAQVELRERTKVTVESVTENLREAYNMAKSNAQAGAMVQAEMGIAKIHGMLIDKQQQIEPRAEDMTPDELKAELARVQDELDALENPSPAEHKGHTQH